MATACIAITFGFGQRQVWVVGWLVAGVAEGVDWA